MSQPTVSIVIETITARFDSTTGSLPDDVAATLEGVTRQSYPRDRIETIVVIDHEVADEVAKALRTRYPDVKFVPSDASNYFAAKNAGAAASSGEVIALLDGDCVPSPDWLEVLLSRLVDGVDVVAGCTRYEGASMTAKTFSIPDFAYVLADEDGASGFNINNVAFRREVLLTHPFDERIRRNGGCYFLFHQLRAAEARVVYEPRARVAHGLDIRGLGFIRKHFDRGYDGAIVYRLDDQAVLRGTRLVRRGGAAALIAIYGRRLVVDWIRMLRHRRQIGIPLVALPYFGAVAATTRSIELAGALTATIRGESAS
jgi:glycosyltransferase involved in cell wall biosynthesis